MSGAPRNRTRSGFTLLEVTLTLAIVFALLGLTVALSRFARRAMYESRARAALGRIEGALQEYRLENGVFPDVTNLADSTVTHWLPAGFRLEDPWERPYVYVRKTPYVYDLYSEGPTTNSLDDVRP